MKRATVIGILALCYTSMAQDSLETVIEPRQRPHKNMILVLDCSGSMGGECWDAARGYADLIARQGVDQAALGVVTFGPSTARWTHKGKDWAELPDAKAVDAAKAWLDSIGASGETLVLPALRNALSDKRDPLTLVLVSDGMFGEGPLEILNEVARLQAARVKVGRKPATIVGLGIYDSTSCSVAATSSGSVMGVLGKAYGGGLYRAKAQRQGE